MKWILRKVVWFFRFDLLTKLYLFISINQEKHCSAFVNYWSQELASKIVERRLKHGPYRSLDELAKLGGMGKHRFAMIKPYLKINGISNGSVTPTPSNGSSLPTWNGQQASSTPKVNNTSRQTTRINRNKTSPTKMYKFSTKLHRKFHIPWKFASSNALRVVDFEKVGNVFLFCFNRYHFFNRSYRNDEDKKSVEFNAGITEDEIWELLSVASPRPCVYPEFMDEIFCRSSIRIATWNLTGFNADKAGNPGVMEVICRTILENRFVFFFY